MSNVTNINFHSTVFNYKKGDYVSINKELAKIDFNAVFAATSDINEAIGSFYKILFEIISCHIPTVNISTSNYPAWFNSKLISEIKLKKRLHSDFKLLRTNDSYNKFSIQRSLCKKLANDAHKAYILNIENSIHHNPKRFWSFLNEGKNVKSIPNCVFLNEEKAAIGQDVVNLFGKHFQSSFTASDPNYNYECDLQPSSLFINSVSISESDLSNSLKNLDDNLSLGPDGIPSFFLKNCAENLVHLLYLYRCSLESGIFPDIWKNSYITPLLKKGDPSLVTNYRPIAKNCSMAKLFDSIVEQKLSSFLRPFILDEQHGFMRNKSTTSNLCEYNDSIVHSLDRNCQVDSIYTDMKSAFDCVNHNMLITKLRNYGVVGKLLDWIKSFLTGRKLMVKIGNFVSDEFEATSGVPQGSHCGPLFFNVSINDLPLVVKYSICLLFADDLKIFKEIRTPHDASYLQKDLNSIQDWMVLNKFSFNVKKCFVISFYSNNFVGFEYSIGGSYLERVFEIKDLGIIFDSNLNFNSHVNYISSKSSKMLSYIIRQSSEFTNASTFKILYLTLVRPLLLYASQIWTPRYSVHSKMIESVQHRFLRVLAYKMGRPLDRFDHDYSDIATEVQICSLESLRVYYDILFFYKIVRNFVYSPYLLYSVNLYVPSRSLRQSNVVFYIKLMKNDLNFRCIIDRCAKYYNDLLFSIDIFGINISCFKRMVYQILAVYS